MTDPVPWTWSDGWILMALYLAGEQRGAELWEIVAAADAINHAIPTAREMSQALTRFAQSGIVQYDESRYSLATNHLAAIKQAHDDRGGLFAGGDKGLNWLRAARVTLAGSDQIEVSESEMKSAYEQYVQQSRRK